MFKFVTAFIIIQNFRTSSNQPDCKKFRNMTEMTPALEAYAAVLSGGPVGPSDQVGTANATLIMATWCVVYRYTSLGV